MPEMNDYSGPFKPDLTFADFSKETLLKLMNVWQYAWLHMSGAWFEAVRERVGLDTANDCVLQAWLTVADRVHPRYLSVLNFQPTTVREALKCFQVGPDNSTGGLFRCEYDFRSDNHVIMTVLQCRTLAAYERSAPEMIHWTCHVLEQAVFQKQLINPAIKVTPLILPPRQDPNGIACKWEFKIEP